MTDIPVVDISGAGAASALAMHSNISGLPISPGMTGGGDRYSMPFFFDTDMDAVIECLPTCCSTGDPPRYEPVRYGDYLMDRLDRSYAYRKNAAAE
jgi:hypothetical protein